MQNYVKVIKEVQSYHQKGKILVAVVAPASSSLKKKPAPVEPVSNIPVLQMSSPLILTAPVAPVSSSKAPVPTATSKISAPAASSKTFALAATSKTPYFCYY